MMGAVATTLRYRAHVGMTRALDRIFSPSHDLDEISAWDAFWCDRIDRAELTGEIFEHDVPGKRWLYERVVDAVQYCAGGSLEGKQVAEIGCGSGYAAMRTADRGASPSLIDASPSALRYARQIARRLHIESRVAFHQRNLFELGGLGPFDVSFQSGVLEHYSLEDAVEIVRAMVGATRPGGTVIVILPNLLSPVLLSRMIRSRSKGSERFFSQWLLERVFREAGLRKSRGGYVNALLPVETPIPVLEWSRKMGVERWAGSLSALFLRWSVVPEKSA